MQPLQRARGREGPGPGRLQPLRWPLISQRTAVPSIDAEPEQSGSAFFISFDCVFAKDSSLFSHSGLRSVCGKRKEWLFIFENALCGKNYRHLLFFPFIYPGYG